jgi:hypothetical protein
VIREKIAGTTAARSKTLMSVLVPGDVVITPASDRSVRDTTDPVVIAQERPRRKSRWSMALPHEAEREVRKSSHGRSH